MDNQEYEIFEPNDMTIQSETLPCGVCFGLARTDFFYRSYPYCEGCNYEAK